jgi:hypothetical protein
MCIKLNLGRVEIWYHLLGWCPHGFQNLILLAEKMCKGEKKVQKNRVSCRNLFHELRILTGTSILCFTEKNMIYTTQYSNVHSYNIIHKQNLYVQSVILSIVKEG